MQKNLNGEMKQHAQEIRHIMEQRYADDVRRRKEEDREQKRLYSDTLKYQKAIQEQMKNNYGKMTMQEKRFNKEDLRAYRQGEKQPHMGGLIPGINNISSVGAQPTIRRAVQRDLTNDQFSPIRGSHSSSQLGNHPRMNKSVDHFREHKRIGGIADVDEGQRVIILRRDKGDVV